MTTTSYPFAAREIQNYVDGAFAATGAHFDNVNPVTGEVVARVALADQPMVDRAVAAARRALKGPWGRMSQAERCKLLVRVAEGIEARFDDFAAAEIADTGKSLHQARTIDIPRGAANFRAFAGLAEARAMPSFRTDLPDGRSAINYAIARPLGVVAIISPWNLPLLLMTWKVAPALACGNVVVVKPSE